MNDQYLTLSDLSRKLGNRSRSAIYLDVAAKRLPPPLKLGGRILWRESVIDAHLRALEATE
jgi:prophage regulatory protein